jgi:hypothetical protein
MVERYDNCRESHTFDKINMLMVPLRDVAMNIQIVFTDNHLQLIAILQIFFHFVFLARSLKV